MSGRRKFLFLQFSAAALVLALASFAFACTDVQGWTEITEITHNSSASNAQCPDEPNPGWKCAAPGDTIKVRAHSGPLRYVAGSNNVLIDYYLFLLPEGDTADDDMDTCMPAAGGEGMGATSVPMMQLTDEPVHATGGGSSSVIPETTVTVPKLSGSGLLGPAWVCFMGGGWVNNQDLVTDTTNEAASRFLAMNATHKDSLEIVLI